MTCFQKTKTKMSFFRGIFDFVNHPITNKYRDIAWEEYVRKQTSPYGVPRFLSRTHAFESAQQIPQVNKVSCVDQWDYFEQILFPYIETIDQSTFMYPMNNNDSMNDSTNDSMNDDDQLQEYDDHLFDPFEKRMNTGRFRMDIPTMKETVRYIWNYLRSGILVVVKNGRVMLFCPFYNPQFKNTWPAGIFNHIKSDLPVENWWANGGILCTQYTPWGTHFCMQLKDYIAETVSKMNVQHAIFCVNKRDYPQYKYNYTLETFVEPYGFVFNRDDHDPYQDLPNSSDIHTVLPMFSFYGGERFLDFLIPPTEDLEISTGSVYLTDDTYHPHLSKTSIRDLTNINIQRTSNDLHTKRSVAFFRGAATGAGTTPLTNTRLRLFSLAQQWKDPRVDALCVSLKNRIHKHYQEEAREISSSSIDFPVSESFFVPMSEQIQNKYLIYIEGHCAACRLGMMLSLGCVVFIVKSTCVAPDLWYTHLLKENVHFVSIENDFSNLQEKLDYLEQNQEFAQTLANNARTFWELYMSRKSLVIYFGYLLNSL